jgi:hypothetical protein
MRSVGLKCNFCVFTAPPKKKEREREREISMPRTRSECETLVFSVSKVACSFKYAKIRIRSFGISNRKQ